MQKRRRERKTDGSWICYRCKLQGSKVETELQAAKKERDLAAEKAKEASLLLKEEKKKRLQLEDKITQRLCRGGGYKLEGLDATIVPDGVVAYELEEANRHMREASEEASRIAKKLEVERQEKRDIVRQARKDRADLVKDLTVVKSLQSEFEKAGNRRTRQAESSERQARAEQDRLAKKISECRKLLVTERQEKRDIIREDRKTIVELCESLEVSKLQQSEYETDAIRQARQAQHAKSGEMNAKEMLTQASCTQEKMSSQLAHLRSQRKVEKQAERRSRLVGGPCVRSASVTEKLEQELRKALAENELLVTDLADVSGINTLYSICRLHFKLLLCLFICLFTICSCYCHRGVAARES